MINSLLDLIQGFPQLRVLVIGDGMLDRYLWGVVKRMCPEVPVPIVDIAECQDVAGGAANTAANAARLGAQVEFLSVIGTDEEGDRLQRQLQEVKISTQWLLRTPQRRTLTKQRVMADSHMALRCDWGSTEPLARELEERLLAQLVRGFRACSAIIVSDYSYGILTPRVIDMLATLQASTP